MEQKRYENPYDDAAFYDKYAQMERSRKGLDGAGEWHALKKLLPDFKGKRVLDLGCGYGWHCVYAVQNGARYALGIDLSHKMLDRARKSSQDLPIEYVCGAIEEFEVSPRSYDVAISSLALHYVADLNAVFRRVADALTRGGRFVFSIEHPIFTAQGRQDWIYDADGSAAYWPVDRYFDESARDAIFLGEKVVKQHHTLTGIFRALKDAGFAVTDLVEPTPDPAMIDLPGMRDELRRPMMLLVGADLRGKDDE